MKKLIVLPVVLVLVAGLCFAQVEEAPAAPPELPKIEKFDLEISVGYPVHWTNAVHDEEFYWFHEDYNMEDKSVTANTAIGFSMLFNFSRKVGFSLDADFFYGAKIAGFANPSSDYISLFGANALMGPVFYIYNGIFLRIPLTIGAHLYYFSDDFWMPALGGIDKDNPPTAAVPPDTSGYWMNRRDFQVGPGISLGVQFHFNNSIYIFSRTNVAIDVFRWHEIKFIADYDDGGTDAKKQVTKSEMEFVISWEVKPVIGVGVKF
ncbi:MAG: hypothetical protein LBB72_07600 [Spirochaetaceae bacterium]|jgi:hypothetical protein|nr:hypothetical protein [Spirochaetaceae bacterium]